MAKISDLVPLHLCQVFPDVVSVDLPMPLSSGEMKVPKQWNRGFAFVKFSSHAVRPSWT